MVSLKYAMKSILKTYIISILLIIQMSVCTILIYNGVTMSYYFQDRINAMNSIRNGKEIYSIVLNNGEDVYIKRKCKDTNKVIEYIKSIDEVKLAYTETCQLQFKIFKKNDEFKNKLTFGYETPNNGYINVNSIGVGRTFFDAFNIKLTDGKVDDLFISTRGYIPIILGSKYKKIYSIGSIIEGFNLQKERYKVVGFLEKNQYYTLNGHNFNGNFVENMDTFVLAPSSKEQENVDISSYILIFNKDLPNKENILNNIINEGKKYDIQIDYENISNEVEFFNNIKKQDINMNRVFLYIIIIFATVTTLVVFINRISFRKKQFGVHIMCGGKLKDIGLSILFEFMILSILALIISFGYLILNDFIIEIVTIRFNWVYFGITSVLVLIFMSFLSIFPIRKILKIDVNTLVRGEE